MKKEIKKIKQLMMDSLELPKKQKDGKIYLSGDYVCHEDIPEETLNGFDEHFTVCGEDENSTYLVAILKINF